MCSGRCEEVARDQIVVYAAPLRWIEDVEGLSAELESSCLCELEMLEQSHVEVRRSGVAQAVATGVSKRKPRGIRICRRIVESRGCAISSARRNVFSGIPDQIRVCTR